MLFIKDVTHSNAVLAEQVRMLYNSSTPSSVATMANGSVLSIALWSVVDHTSIIIWFTCLSLITAGRLLLNRAYKKTSPTPDNIAPWANAFILGTILIACVWAAASLFLYPMASFGHQVFLAFVLAGMCAGAVTTLSFLKQTILVYLSLVLLPIGIEFMLYGSDLSLAMAVMTLFFYLITTSSGIRICNNTTENIIIRLKSIEGEKALQDSEARYRSIFDSAPLGIVHYDENEIVRSCNPAFLHLINNNSPYEKALNQILSSPEATQVMRRTMHGGEGIFKGDIHLLGSKKALPLRIHFRGILNERQQPSGGVAIIEDRSDDLRVERLKNEFVSTVSHELRTPLTAIKGALDLLSTDIVKQQATMQDELLANARRNSDRLLNLINDILDIEKIKQGKLEYKISKTDITSLVEQSLASNTPYAQQHKVQYVLTQKEENIFADVDSNRITQVLTNLLSNAAKFSHENSKVEISISQQADDHTVTITVKDYGCGIPKEFHNRIFSKFSQYDGSDIRKVGGTGLGLNISKAIIEHHQGQLLFNSTPGQGSIFYVILPISQTS